jgi:hypothetical protein
MLAMAVGVRARADEPKLVTSSVELEPILIGEAPKDPDATFENKGGWDGALAIVIDTPYQIWSSMGTYIHLAAFDPKFKPAAGARVFMDGRILGQMDKNGTFVFSEATNQDASYGNRHNIDIVHTKGGKSYHGTTYFNAYPRTQGFESASVFVYTDRGVYNPGQTIRIRAIGWRLRDDFDPLVGKPLDLLLKDEGGKVVAGGQVETDGYGIARLDIPLPEHAPEGRYSLEATYERETARAKLRIERFVAPVIDIQHDLGRFLERDTKAMKIEVTLGMFGGGAFTKGQMTVTAEARGEVRFEKKMEVEGKGPHEVPIDDKALAKIKAGLGEDENVRFTISVTDEYGRSDELKRDVRYTSNPYRAVVEMDKDQYSEGDTVRAMVRLVDLDEVPIRNRKVKAVIESKTLWSETDKSGIAKFEFPMGKTTIYGNVYLEGVDQSLATIYAYYYPPRPMTSEIPEGVVKEKRDTEIAIRFPTEYVPVEDVVHVDIVDSSGALIGAALVPVGKDKDGYVARGTFPAPSWGSMLLTIFCLGRQGGEPVGLLTEGQNLPVVADRELEITLKGLPARAAPGQKLSVSAEVRDRDGKLVTASVGASVVDQAVIGMLDPLELTPMDKFYNPQLKVLSTTGSKILTWPVVSRNWGFPLYDIALPPFGYRAGGQNVDEQTHAAQSKPKTKGDVDKKAQLKPAKKYKKEGGKTKDGEDYFEGELGTYGTGSGGGGVGYGYGVGMGSASLSAKSSPAPAMLDMPMEESGVEAPMGGMVAVDDVLAAGAFSASIGAATPAGPQPQVRVIVRTNFAETSLWEPELVAQGGKLGLGAVLPDSITTQTVTLIASDKKGRVGMVRGKVEVAQDLYARSDLPATLTLGDEVEVTSAVRNFTKGTVKVKVGLASGGLEIVGPKSQALTVPRDETGVAAFVVRPLRAGKIQYEVYTEGGGVKDVERRELYVHPAGLPTLIRARGKVEKGKPFKADVHLSGKDAYVTAMLNVSFPGAVPVIQGLESIVDQPGGAIDFISSNALVTAMVYRYLESYGQDEKALDVLRLRMQANLASLLMAQNADGGWGWHVKLIRSDASGQTGIETPKSNPYMTAQTIEGLVEMKRAGLPVPEQNVRMGLGSLVSTLPSDSLWSVDEIAFWEGKTQEVQLGVSAEIFHVMVLACEAFPALVNDFNVAKTLDELTAVYRPLITDPSMRDPMAMSHAAIGVWKWAKLRGTSDPYLEQDLELAAKRLVALRDESYWEPSWFNAFGGTIEATAASMEMLHAFDSEKFEDELRRSLQYILSTQESFGAWHNARGTAAAIRALLIVPPTKKEVASTVEVRVNGKTVRTVEINPDDPFISAVSLRQLEITSHLATGDNKVEILYDGNLTAPVNLVVSKWSEKAGSQAMAMPSAPDIAIARSVKDLSGNGQLVRVGIHAELKGSPRPVTITEFLPSNAEVEAASLDALILKGKILGYDLRSDRIVFYPKPGTDKIDLTYRLNGTRKGLAIQPGPQIAPVSDPSAAVSGKATKLRVK